MIAQIRRDLIKSLQESGMVNKIFALIDEDDVDSMISKENMPAVGYEIEPTGIDKNFRRTAELNIFITNYSTDDEDVLCTVADTNTSIAELVVRSSDYIEGCSIKTNYARKNDFTGVLVMSMVTAKIVY